MNFEEKTEQLLDYLRLIPERLDIKEMYDFKTLSGQAVAYGIINTEYFSIAKTMFADSTRIDWHNHPEHEHIIMYSGEIVELEVQVTKDNIKKKILSPGCSIFIRPGQAHRLITTIGECWVIVITVPGTTTFPKGILDEY